MESILSAIIAGAVTLIGVLIANNKSQAVTDTKWWGCCCLSRSDTYRRILSHLTHFGSFRLKLD